MIKYKELKTGKIVDVISTSIIDMTNKSTTKCMVLYEGEYGDGNGRLKFVMELNKFLKEFVLLTVRELIYEKYVNKSTIKPEFSKYIAINLILGIVQHSLLKKSMLKHNTDSYTESFKEYIQSPMYAEDEILIMVKEIEISDIIVDMVAIKIDCNLVRLVRQTSDMTAMSLENREYSITTELTSVELDMNARDADIRYDIEGFLTEVEEIIQRIETGVEELRND